MLCIGLQEASGQTRKLIQDAGHTVVMALDEIEVSAACKRHFFDVILLGPTLSGSKKRALGSLIDKHCPFAKVFELDTPSESRVSMDADSSLEASADGLSELVDRATAPTTQRQRILIADDAKAWRVQIRKLLESQPEWEIVDEACNGKQALEKAQELRPDIVLLDIGMPIMNGLQAANEIRQTCPGSLIIFVTQTSDDDLVQAASEIAAGYVLKANVLSELVPAIALAVRNLQVE